MKRNNIFILIAFVAAIVITALVTRAVVKSPGISRENATVIKLINVAKQYSIIADGTGDTRLLTDGDASAESAWWTQNEQWPATLTMALPPKGIVVDELILKFLQETEYPNRSVNIDIQYEVVGKEEMEKVEVVDFKFFSNDYSFVFPDNSVVSKIVITLSNPKDSGQIGTFWPALGELELYVPKN